MEQIVDMQNVEKAWRKVKANKGAPGPDGITLDEFPQRFRAEWPDDPSTTTRWNLSSRNQRGVSLSPKVMALKDTLVYPISWKGSFSSASSKS